MSFFLPCAGHQLLLASQPGYSAVSLLSPPVYQLLPDTSCCQLLSQVIQLCLSFHLQCYLHTDKRRPNYLFMKKRVLLMETTTNKKRAYTMNALTTTAVTDAS
jgi:hypothetical protein